LMEFWLIGVPLLYQIECVLDVAHN